MEPRKCRLNGNEKEAFASVWDATTVRCYRNEPTLSMRVQRKSSNQIHLSKVEIGEQ